MRRLINLTIFLILLFGLADKGFAQADIDPNAVVVENANKMIQILQGPVTKLLAAIILLAGVAGLLRGRHKIALSCGIAFVVLLFLPMILRQVSPG